VFRVFFSSIVASTLTVDSRSNGKNVLEKNALSFEVKMTPSRTRQTTRWVGIPLRFFNNSEKFRAYSDK
jgi:hypothetical protein